MKPLKTMIITLGILILFGMTSADAGKSTQTRPDEKKPARQKTVAVTIWVLSYERRDANPLADATFLPKLIDPALAKLRQKGAKKINFNFKMKQLYIWIEGKQDATLKDIQAAFPILELKIVAKAAFPAN